MASDTRPTTPDVRAFQASDTMCAVAGANPRRRAELGAVLGSIGYQVQSIGAGVSFERLGRVAVVVTDRVSYGLALPSVVARAYALLTLPIVVLGGLITLVRGQIAVSEGYSTLYRCSRSYFVVMVPQRRVFYRFSMAVNRASGSGAGYSRVTAGIDWFGKVLWLRLGWEEAHHARPTRSKPVPATESSTPATILTEKVSRLRLKMNERKRLKIDAVR